MAFMFITSKRLYGKISFLSFAEDNRGRLKQRKQSQSLNRRSRDEVWYLRSFSPITIW